MTLTALDYGIILVFFLAVITIGIVVSKKSGKSSSEFFLSGRNMPWWLLGFSMVATTFSTDTPNFVTDVVRKDGVSGNWIWWAFLFTGLDRKSTRLNSSHVRISYAVFCLKKKII